MSSASPRRFVIRGYSVSPVLVASLVVVALTLSLSILPVRTWVNQGRKADQVQAELDRLNEETEELKKQQEELGTDAEIERRAREDFGYVYPGEEQFVVSTEE